MTLPFQNNVAFDIDDLTAQLVTLYEDICVNLISHGNEGTTYTYTVTRNDDYFLWYAASGTLNTSDHGPTYISGGKYITSGDVYDTYSDSTIDLEYWTFAYAGATSTDTEVAGINWTVTSEGYIKTVVASDPNSNSNATISSYGTGYTLNLKPASGVTSECLFAYKLTAAGTGGGVETGTVYLRDNDGHEVSIVSDSGDGSVSVTNTIRVLFKTGDVVDIYKNSESITTPNVDISSLTGTSIYLKFHAAAERTSGNSNCSITIYKIRYVRNAAVTNMEIITDVQTASASVSEAFAHINTNDVGTNTYEISADNGSNYTEFTHNTLTAFGTAGTQLKYKLTLGGTCATMVKIYGLVAIY